MSQIGPTSTCSNSTSHLLHRLTRPQKLTASDPRPEPPSELPTQLPAQAINANWSPPTIPTSGSSILPPLHGIAYKSISPSLNWSLFTSHAVGWSLPSGRRIPEYRYDAYMWSRQRVIEGYDQQPSIEATCRHMSRQDVHILHFYYWLPILYIHTVVSITHTPTYPPTSQASGTTHQSSYHTQWYAHIRRSSPA